MKQSFIVLALALLMAPATHAADRCAVTTPGTLPALNQSVRLAAGDLHAKLAVFANVGTQHVGRGEVIECLADAATTAAWNYKQLANVLTSKEALYERFRTVHGKMRALRHAFRNSALYQEKEANDAFIQVQVAYHRLKDLVKP